MICVRRPAARPEKRFSWASRVRGTLSIVGTDESIQSSWWYSKLLAVTDCCLHLSPDLQKKKVSFYSFFKKTASLRWSWLMRLWRAEIVYSINTLKIVHVTFERYSRNLRRISLISIGLMRELGRSDLWLDKVCLLFVRARRSWRFIVLRWDEVRNKGW